MDIKSYNWMKIDIVYDAYYQLGGKCLIRKDAEDIPHGFLTVRFEDGTIKKRHYAFFQLLLESETKMLGTWVKP